MIPIGDDRRPGFFAAATWAIVAVNVYAFYRELTAPSAARFIDAYALVPYNITHGVALGPPAPQPYWLTIFSSTVVHGGFWHIAFNLLFLAVFAPLLERSMGHLKFVLFYLLCGLAGAAAQIAAGPNSHVPEIGASGAIAGVLGAYIVRFPTNPIRTIVPIGCFPLFLRLPAVLVIGIWAAIQLANGIGRMDPHAEQGGVAYFAHIGGFAFGALASAVFEGRKRPRVRRTRT